MGRDKWKNFARGFEQYLKDFLPYISLFENANPKEYEMMVFIDQRHYKTLSDIIPSTTPISLVPIDEEYLRTNSKMWRRLDREKAIMESEHYRKLMFNRLAYPENHNPKYTLINHIKIDLICHAMSMTDAEYFSWVDFGFFKLPENIPKNLLDLQKLDLEKINYTIINPVNENDKHVMYTMLYAPEKIGGFFFFGRRDKLLEYQKLYHDVHLWFQQQNLADDDQHLDLRCYFADAGLFQLHSAGGWHRALVYFQK
jgi:hypothetical protein